MVALHNRLRAKPVFQQVGNEVQISHILNCAWTSRMWISFTLEQPPHMTFKYGNENARVMYRKRVKGRRVRLLVEIL